MKPKKSLPEGSTEVTRQGQYILVKHQSKTQTRYGIYRFYISDDGPRYFPRGGGGPDLDKVMLELERITGVKISAD